MLLVGSESLNWENLDIKLFAERTVTRRKRNCRSSITSNKSYIYLSTDIAIFQAEIICLAPT